MKFPIYLRTSKLQQNIENQKIPLIKYAQSMGWEYDIFIEQESTRKSRPVQWGLFNDLLKKKYDGLLIYKLDRWARSTKELIEHTDQLVAKNIRIISYTENIDFSSSMGQFMRTVMAAFAQLERDLIRERTLAGLARAKARGKILGRHRKTCKCKVCLSRR